MIKKNEICYKNISMLNTIDLNSVHFFNSLISDYLNGTLDSSLFNLKPSLDNIENQILAKKLNYSYSRSELVNSLQESYSNIDISKVHSNVNLLAHENTFTITTGHQLNIFTGPVYFVYKIIHTIVLAEELNKRFKEYNFVPVYWMASEDHDFEEINHFHLFGKKYIWNTSQKGAVGRFNLLDFSIEEELKSNLSDKDFSHPIIQLFINSYKKSKTLSEAHFNITHQLFKDKGLVIIDGDNKVFKKVLKPIFLAEIKNNVSFKKVSESNDFLKSKKHKIQVNPRHINLFYLDKNLRERIIYNEVEELYEVLNTNLCFNESKMIEIINQQPEKISPNVILRPLYQEILLPNLMYVGGAGEISYWLQLKNLFESFSVVFPMLTVRKSFLSQKGLTKKMKHLNTNLRNVLTESEEVFTKKYFTSKAIEKHISVDEQKNQMIEIFNSLRELAVSTDQSLLPFAESEKVKSLKVIDKFQQKLEKSIKQKDDQSLKAINTIYKKVFPHQSFQERVNNVVEYYLGDENQDFVHDIYKLTSLSNPFGQAEMLVFD